MQTETIERKSVRKISDFDVRKLRSLLWGVIGDINDMLKEIGYPEIKVEHQEHDDGIILSVAAEYKIKG